ncbi:UNVERIFIED_CONTAM: hypothetical protein GTU68_052799, partial [Idotea baltica]|nr:hypothetical protein [Idotea baltica]
MVSGTFGDATVGNFNSDTECLISRDHNQMKPYNRLREVLKRRSSMQSLPYDQRQGIHRDLNHPAFQSISIEQ